jgi:hypothetical protein
MGLRDTVKAAVATAFTAAGDIPETATYRRYHSQDPAYQPQEGYVFRPKTDYSLQMIFTRFKEKEVDNKAVLMTDMKCIIQAASFTDESITPKLTDQIIKDSEIWEMENLYLDPTESVYIFQLRRP